MYTRSISRSSLSSGFKLESLPPTAAAAKLNPYLELQQWMGNNYLSPTDSGSKDKDGILVPLTSDRPVVLTHMLRIVPCSCKTGCRKTCGCQYGVLWAYWSPEYSHCNWQTFNQAHALAASQDSDDDPQRCACDNFFLRMSFENLLGVRHAGVKRQGYTVYQCAAIVMDKHAATPKSRFKR